MLYAFYTLPSPGNFIASIGAWASPMFDELFPLALVIIGLSVGVIIAMGIINLITDAVYRFTHKNEY